MRGIFAIFIAISLLAAPGRADTPLRVLVDRDGDTGVAFYVSTPAEALLPIFGRDASGLLGDSGTVEFQRLYQGTFQTADHLFEKITATVGGAPAEFEAMSMMVHAPGTVEDLTDTVAAQIAVAVCAAPDQVAGRTLDGLLVYAGYYAWPVDGEAEIKIQFPATGRDTITFEIRDFVQGEKMVLSSAEVPDGGTLTLPARQPSLQIAGLSAQTLGAGAAALFALGAFGFARRLRAARQAGT